MAREIKVDQNYRDMLLKLIPSEIVAAYMVLAGIIPQDYAKWGLLIVSVESCPIPTETTSRASSLRRAAMMISLADARSAVMSYSF